MNILTFDIEDWYNCDFITTDFNWDKYEVRIYEGIERILDELTRRNIKGTFFCLGWIAEKHPDVIRMIYKNGHQIGCHSYQHELAFRFTREEFKEDTKKAKRLIEDLIGEQVNSYRAPGFSITENNTWAFEVLAELGFVYDSSILPAKHDYGGFSDFGIAEPAILKLANGGILKEFPISPKKIMNQSIVYSGGGFFRLFPYPLIKFWASNSNYMMTYFHTRDFDPDQPIIKSLPLTRKFKSYVGLSGSYAKFQKFLNDFKFTNVAEADKTIDWSNAKIVKF